MRILAIIPSLHRGGAERVISLLSQEWAKNHTVEIIVFDSSDPAYAWGGKIIDLALPSKSGIVRKGVHILRRVISLSFLFRKKNPDRIISLMESANIPASLAAMFVWKLSRLWLSVHNDPARFSKFYRFLIPYLYRLPIRVVGVSEGVTLELANHGVPLRKLLTINNPVPGTAPPLSRNLSKPNGSPNKYILGVGRLHYQKGFDLLIEAFSKIINSDLNLVILGEGDDLKDLELLAKRLGISHRVYMPGAVSDIWGWYRYAECFVLSSRYEGWGNVLLEAMSQGCPVISFDCNYGPSEIITHGVNGYLVEIGNIQKLGETINFVLQNPLSRATIVENGLKRCLDFDIEMIAKKWTEDS